MKRIDDHQTSCLWDEWGHLGPKRRRLLDQDWPGLFRQHLFQELPVQDIARVFKDGRGRPSKELYAICGALILQVVFDLTDEQAAQAFDFDLRWHYALNMRGESDEDKYICVRTLKAYRKKMIDLGLEQALFSRLSRKLLDLFKVNTSRQRLDSSHLRSAMRDLSRMQLFMEVIKKFLVELKKKAPEQYRRVDEPLRESYEWGERSGCFAMKPSQSGKGLAEVAQDLWLLVEMFKGCKAVMKWRAYGHLCRVLREQCEVVDAQDDSPPERVKLKAPQEVKGDSLQNPSDEQSTYDKHKGRGYQVQLMETYQTDQEEAQPPEAPDLITHVKVEEANRSDVDALEQAIEETARRGCKPESVLADGAYASYDNWQKAQEDGVELVAPANKGSEDKNKRLGYSQFTYEADGRIRACPAGMSPVKTGRTANGNFQAWFERESCLRCPFRDKCLIIITGAKARLPNYTPKRAFLSAHRVYERSEEFKDKYRWRGGIEATFSRMKRQLGANRLRVRGMRAMQYNVTLKALAINILRCAKARMAGFEDVLAPYLACLSSTRAILAQNRLHQLLLAA